MRGFDSEQLQSLMLTCLELFRRSPGQLQQIVSDLASGRLGINVNLDESARLRRTNDQRTKLVAVAVLSVAVATLLTARELPNLFGISSAWPLGAVLALLLIMIVSKWRRLR